MSADTLALVGTVGGAGTTRMTIEAAGTLSRTGRDVAILDAAFGTQGLARYYDGRIDPDLTAVLAGDAALEDVLLPLDVAGPGAVHLAPTLSPLERFARAMTAGAAEAFERQVAGAALTHDVVIVDTPPLAGNQAIAAVSAVDAVALVTPDSWRGRDGLALMTERLADVGIGYNAVVATFADGSETAIPDAAAWIPSAAETAPHACPTSDHGDAVIAPAVAEAVEEALNYSLDLPFDRTGGLRGYLSTG